MSLSFWKAQVFITSIINNLRTITILFIYKIHKSIPFIWIMLIRVQLFLIRVTSSIVSIFILRLRKLKLKIKVLLILSLLII